MNCDPRGSTNASGKLWLNTGTNCGSGALATHSRAAAAREIRPMNARNATTGLLVRLTSSLAIGGSSEKARTNLSCREMRTDLWTIAALFALGSCPAAAQPSRATYTNPVLDADFPDPTVIRAPDGYYYGYATQTQRGGKWVNIQLAPFVDVGRPLLCGTGFVNIDSMAFDDPATGKHLLYWGSGFEPLKVQELAPDRLGFAPGTAPKELLSPNPVKDAFPVLIEGSWMIRHGGYYYLFYSGDNCCGPKANYAVMVARSRSATGPFETLEQATGKAHSIILEKRGHWIAPGHNSIVTDRAGGDWIVYHAVDSRRPRENPSDELNTRRVMLIDPIEWRNGWPVIDGPSSGPRKAPTP